MYLGLRVANLIFANAWTFHLAQWFGRIGLGLFTRKDGWIHSLPSVGGKWTQTRDLRGFPARTSTSGGQPAARSKMTAPADSRQRILDSIRAATKTVAKDPAQLASAYAALPRNYIRHGSLSNQNDWT